MLLLLLSLLGNAPVPGQRRRGGSATSWRLRPVHSLLYLCTGSSLRLEHCTPHLPALSTVLWVMSAVKIGKSGARELYFQRAPPATRAAPIRCWCEWIFDAVFACNKQLSSVILHRSCSVPPIPFLCIFTNLEVQERYDTIRDAILTCARKPTWVTLIYSASPDPLAGTLLPIIRGAWTSFPCAPRHFNHCASTQYLFSITVYRASKAIAPNTEQKVYFTLVVC